MHTTSAQDKLPSPRASQAPLNGDDVASFISELLYSAPLYRKLFSLRREHPELAHDLDEIARAIRQVTAEIETYVRAHCASTPTDPPNKPAPR